MLILGSPNPLLVVAVSKSDAHSHVSNVIFQPLNVHQHVYVLFVLMPNALLITVKTSAC